MARNVVVSDLVSIPRSDAYLFVEVSAPAALVKRWLF
jgi:hypothetical protein